MRTLSLAFLIGLIGSSLAHAAEIHGIKMPDQIKVDGKGLSLNGMGLRQATIFNVNVYAAALYVETPSSQDANQLIASDQIKSLQMMFMRDVDAKDVAKAWTEGFEKNCTEDCEAGKVQLGKLKAIMTTDMKKGDTMAIHFLPNQAELILNGKKAGLVEGKAFVKNLLRIWLGKNPPNSGLKQGLLGIKE